MARPMSLVDPAMPAGPARAALLAVAVLMAIVFAPSVASAAEPQLPALAGRVVDLANILDAAAEAELTAELAALEQKSTDQLVVVTLPSLQGYPIEEFGYKLGRHWGIGQAGKDNGVLLIVAPNDRKVRIEVGRRLEPLLTDAMSRLIIDNAILPGFRRGDFAGGIKAGVRDIRAVLLGDAAEVERRSVVPETSGLDWSAVIFFLIWIAIIAYIFWRAHRAARQGRTLGAGRGRRRTSSDVIVIPGGWGGSGSWGGGDSGGGGWSGGGGGFGGGGASGSW